MYQRLGGPRKLQAVVFSRYGQARSIQAREVPSPTPGDGGALVRVRATSVNAGDWHVLRGRPYLMRAMSGLRRPRDGRLGVDIAGVVEEVRGSALPFAPGDEVYGMVPVGAFAEYVAAGSWIVAKPARLNFEEAAAVPAAGCTALQALRDRGNLEPGDRVLIYGAGGGVGTFAVQIAKALGGHVVALTSTQKVDVVRSIGADQVIDYRREDPDVAGRFDLIIDVGATRSLRALRRLLTPGGRLIVVGAGRGVTGPIGRFAAAALRSRVLKQRVIGFVAGPPFAENLNTLSALVEAGKLRPVIDRSYPMPDTVRAIERFGSGEATGKVVITVPDAE